MFLGAVILMPTLQQNLLLERIHILSGWERYQQKLKLYLTVWLINERFIFYSKKKTDSLQSANQTKSGLTNYHNIKSSIMLLMTSFNNNQKLLPTYCLSPIIFYGYFNLEFDIICNEITLEMERKFIFIIFRLL